ncbi:MAG: twitch domain-containing radical SAM protein [Bacteriovoracaceae bacterium]|nr:twitch domain-containing radical SAM protein [Bacteriovoracaceae bacterium]
MTKRENETYLEYRKRLMDPVSSSFCAAKWLNATIWLNNGSTTSCHHPPSHKIPLEEIAANPSAIHNTTFKKERRKEMLTGVRPEECEYCWKIEDIQKDNVSDRIFKTVIYEDKDLNRIANMPWDANVNLKTLEVAFDRACNFACAYCNASFSTSWAKDINNNGFYQDLGPGSHYNNNGAKENIPPDQNPYIEAFWKWWPELATELEEIRVTGGEPLLSPNTWKLFDYFIKHPESNMRLAINSNLGAQRDHIDKFIEKSHNVKNLLLYTSLESFGKEAEYVRDGLNFEQWFKNYNDIARDANLYSLNIMMTINALSMFSTVEFLEMVNELKAKYGKHKAYISVNILRFPDFLNLTTLPDHLLLESQAKLATWYRKNENNPLFNEFELSSLKRLIDYMGDVKHPSRRAGPLNERQIYLRNFVYQYDKRRDKDHRLIFPKALSEWLGTLPEKIPV